jgi:AraC-like DNA-binding protein
MTARPAQPRGALPRVSALLGPREQMQLEAATADRLTLLHRTTVHRIYEDVAVGQADGVIVSAAMVREADVPRLCALVYELPVTPIVGLVSDGGATTVAGTLLLGRAGIARLVDVRDRTGWAALRNAFTLQLPEQSVRAALAAILTAVEVEPDGARTRCSEGVRRFFSAIFAPHATTVLHMAAEFGLPAPTINSRFERAGLPSPKQYLALAKLVRAAYLGEAQGLTLRIISERLQMSSPQSYSRGVRHLTGMSAGEFRRGVHGPAMLERFLAAVVTPYRDILRSFDPLRSRVSLAGSSPSEEAA